MVEWLALVIGNSRLHFAQLQGTEIKEIWDCSHLPQEREGVSFTENIGVFPEPLGRKLAQSLPLYIVSVVPGQTAIFQGYLNSKIITLAHLPLGGIYPSLGSDRAVAVYGAAQTWGLPVLVIDGGTALTFTGLKENYQLVGGAILPGLNLQRQALYRQTATLPKIQFSPNLPPRWSLETETAIASGIIYTVLAGIADFIVDWWNLVGKSPVIFTGGDGEILHHYFSLFKPEIAGNTWCDRHLIVKGIIALKVEQRI